MTSALIFSRDRAAQLDLLIRTIKRNLPMDFFRHIDVLHTGSTMSFRQGYRRLKVEHKGFVTCWKEYNFPYQIVEMLTRGTKTICFFCDDDIVYRPFVGQHPDWFLNENPDVLAVSLRLGSNTDICYPLRQEQEVPYFEQRESLNVWPWARASYDFGYPGSLDGHIFRKAQALDLIYGKPTNPNSLEEILNTNCRGREQLLACYDKSCVVGNPVNMVNETHTSNRYGEEHGFSAEELNERYLDGERLQVRVSPNTIRGAHQEIELKIGVKQ